MSLFQSSCVLCCACADLLLFEKLESGILELHRQDVPALQFISNCILLFIPQAREKGVSLDLSLDVDQATLAAHPGAVPLLYSDQFSCDRFKLEQVVRNLVSNAIKFSPKNDTVQIQVFYDTLASFTDPSGRSGSSTPARRPKPVPVSRARPRLSLVSASLPSLPSLHPHPTFHPLPTVAESPASSRSDLLADSWAGAHPRLGALVIAVRDNGPGISEANQKKLFKNIIQFAPEKTQGGGGSGFG